MKETPAPPPSNNALFQYRPLIVIFLVSLAGAMALSISGQPFMNMAMGLFLSFLATLKLYDLKAFADTFIKYDLLAARFRFYAMCYPFIEILLALLYFSGLWPAFTNCLMIAVMMIGTLGVIRIIRSGSKVKCGCVGTSFSLPVGKVTLLENVSMGLMALANLLGM